MVIAALVGGVSGDLWALYKNQATGTEKAFGARGPKAILFFSHISENDFEE